MEKRGGNGFLASKFSALYNVIPHTSLMPRCVVAKAAEEALAEPEVAVAIAFWPSS